MLLFIMLMLVMDHERFWFALFVFGVVLLVAKGTAVQGNVKIGEKHHRTAHAQTKVRVIIIKMPSCSMRSRVELLFHALFSSTFNGGLEKKTKKTTQRASFLRESPPGRKTAASRQMILKRKQTHVH